MEEKEIGVFSYKCRNCGERFEDTRTTGLPWARHYLLALIAGAAGEIDLGYNTSPRLIELHACNEFDQGVADLVGVINKVK